MKKLFVSLLSLACTAWLGGCLTGSVAQSGGPGSMTVNNTNVDAIISAAQGVFAASGYTNSGGSYPNSISFDKPAGNLGKLMYGSYGVTTTVRATLNMTPIPGTNDIRLSTKVTRVSDAGETGFEDSNATMSLWSGEFKPLLRKIAAQAGGAGPV